MRNKIPLFISLISFITIQLTAQQVSWQKMASFPGAGRNHAIAFSHGTKGYCMTGVGAANYKDFYEYNSLTNSWTKLPDYPGQIRSYGLGFVIGDKAYIGLGHTTGHAMLKDWWEYDFGTSTWTQKKNFPGPGRDHPTCYSMNDKIYMGFGDDNQSVNYKDWWEYNPASDTWTQKTSYPGLTMHHPVAAAYNNIVYVIGGHVMSSGSNYASKATYAYNTLTDTWKKVADMPGNVGKVAGTAFTLGNQIFSGMGIEEPVEVFHNEYFQYDIATDKWTSIADYPGKGTFAAVSFTIGTDGYVVTGADANNNQYQDLYRLHYTPVSGIEETTNLEFNIYPNPVTNAFKIQNEEKNISFELYNTTGCLLGSYIKNDDVLNVDMSNFPNGIYLIRSEKVTKKIIKR